MEAPINNDTYISTVIHHIPLLSASKDHKRTL